MQGEKKLFRYTVVLLIALGIVALYQLFDLSHYFSFEYLKSHEREYRSFANRSFMTAVCVYTLVYVLATALSFPGAAVLTLLGGAMFGFWLGVVLVSLASTVGATIAFLASRYLLRDLVAARYGELLERIDQGMEREGILYLFFLRLNPLVPFFVINLAFGLTSVSATKFFLVSQLGMLLGTAVYVNAGTQIRKLDSLENMFSFEFVATCVALFFFPAAYRVLHRLYEWGQTKASL